MIFHMYWKQNVALRFFYMYTQQVLVHFMGDWTFAA